MKAKRILIVEDDRVLRRACEVGLRKRGYEVVTATDGAEGLDLVLTQSFDLVLLGYRPMIVDGLAKAVLGLTTLDEAMRAAA